MERVLEQGPRQPADLTKVSSAVLLQKIKELSEYTHPKGTPKSTLIDLLKGLMSPEEQVYKLFQQVLIVLIYALLLLLLPLLIIILIMLVLQLLLLIYTSVNDDNLLVHYSSF